MNYFSLNELKCSCGCETQGVLPEFLENLNEIREMYGHPMIITSAYRCAQHPIEAAKQAPGPHSTGLAVDVAVSGGDALRLVEVALACDITGIGIKQRGDISQRFVHLDIVPARPNGPRPHIWSY